MYYVANGVCTVDIVDQAKKLNKNIRNLLPGDHFGEIGMIYGTPRTATVLSKNYSTLAKMSLEIYHDLTTEYPTMVTALKEHIYSRYDDPLTLFCKESLERIPYFQNIGNEAIYDVMFTLTKRF
jgi:CRP-like cAMP-binding protein